MVGLGSPNNFIFYTGGLVHWNEVQCTFPGRAPAFLPPPPPGYLSFFERKSGERGGGQRGDVFAPGWCTELKIYIYKLIILNTNLCFLLRNTQSWSLSGPSPLSGGTFSSFSSPSRFFIYIYIKNFYLYIL